MISDTQLFDMDKALADPGVFMFGKSVVSALRERLRRVEVELAEARAKALDEAATIVDAFPTDEQKQYLADSAEGKNIGSILPANSIVETVLRQAAEAIRARAFLEKHNDS